jgi:hypothetical protein
MEIFAMLLFFHGMNRLEAPFERLTKAHSLRIEMPTDTPAYFEFVRSL